MLQYNIIIYLVFVSLVSLSQCAPMNKDDGKTFLKKYGYMTNDTTDDADFQKSLQDFQEEFTLPVTGQLDTETSNQMEKARCGHPDKIAFKTSQTIWNKRRLTYKFKNYPHNGLSRTVARAEIRKAFKVWAEQIPIDFQEKPEGKVDIDITFNEKGDGPGKTLAYAYFPRVGNVHFDNEQWTTNTKRGYNLFLVAAHELGHSLGLEHSKNKKALLYPYYTYYTNFQLHDDDVSRIQGLYGRRSTGPPSICDVDSINSAIFSSKDQAVYLIKDNYCWKIKGNQVESGYPKLISEVWKGSPSSIDAAYNYGGNMYFHEGRNIWKYDGQMKKSDSNLVTHIDAAVTYETRTYVFKGSNYWRYDSLQQKSGYPKAISSFWTGVPTSIDAVYYENASPYKYFYFFKGTRVYKFNMNDREMKREMSLREYLSC